MNDTHHTRDWVAIILAVGICTALNGFVFAAIYDALTDPAHSGLSENSTQILTGWGGGIIGILGTVFGVRIGTKHANPTEAQPADDDTDVVRRRTAETGEPAPSPQRGGHTEGA